MKDYFKILGLKEGATIEEIRARVDELRKQLHSEPEGGSAPEERAKEIDEAYQMLMLPDFDLDKYLRQSVLSRREDRKKLQRRRVLLSSSILAACVLIGASVFILTGPQKILQVKSTTPTDPSRKTQGLIKETAPVPLSESRAPVAIAQVAPQETGTTVVSESAKPVPPPPPPALKPEPPVEVAKTVTPEPKKAAVPEKAKPVPPPTPAAAKPAPPPPPPALRPAPPAEAAKVAPREPSMRVIPESARSVTPPPPPVLKPEPPVEAAKEVPQEPIKAPIPESAKPASPPAPPALKPEPPVEVAKAIPAPPPPALKPEPEAEAAKAVPREPSRVVPPESVKVPEKKAEREQVASLPVSPPGIAGEREIRQFFDNYVSRYNRKEVEGFISFFSPKAVQNQKDNLEKIRKSYDNFFDQMEEVRYQVVINRIEPQQNRVEVRGQYQLDGVVEKGRKRQSWKGQIRWVLVREDGALKIISLDYQPQSSR